MTTPASNSPTKRTNYLEWTEYFMATAFLTAQRSKDPSTQVGAVIVDDERKVVGIGYNGFPRGCSDDLFPWTKSDADPTQRKYMYVCHAEVNAILNKNSTDVKGCTMYVALFPCNECAKMIIQSGIQRVVYLTDKHAHKPETVGAKRMFDATGLSYVQYKPQRRQHIIHFSIDALTDQLNNINLIDVQSSAKDSPNTGSVSKRTSYLGWTEYFMAIALLAAQRSKDPSTQVGACIVNDEHKIVGVGYNGFPIGCDDDEFPWNRDVREDEPLRNKYLFVCHAEVNAILNKNSADVKGCTIYVALFPCNECAKMIIQSGIRRVMYMSDKYANATPTLAAKRMFDTVGVLYEAFVPIRSHVVIDFDDIDRKNFTQLPATP